MDTKNKLSLVNLFNNLPSNPAATLGGLAKGLPDQNTPRSAWNFLSSPSPVSQTWSWKGASGQWYEHQIYSIYNAPYLSSVNYIFVERRYDGSCSAKYIGESEEFWNRFKNHEKLPDAIKLGANEVHVRISSSTKQVRLKIEEDLILGHNPPLNIKNLGLGLPKKASFFGGSF